MSQQHCIWDESFSPDATTDRGWLKALCAPYDSDHARYYTYETMPVFDPGIGWREQSTVGNYLDYGPIRPGKPGPHVHAVCYWTGKSGYHETIDQAKRWIVEQAKTARPAGVYVIDTPLTQKAHR